MFRLRCKIFERNGKRYLVGLGLLVKGKMMVYAMSDEGTLELYMTVKEWNALEFHWFEDQGPAPRRSEKWPP